MASNLDNQYYPQDIKHSAALINKPGDVEQGSPPSYPLAESEELVVGGRSHEGSSWRCFRRCRGRCAESHTSGTVQKRCKLFRAFKFLFVGWVLLTLIHFIVAGVKFHKAFRTLECTTIIPATAAGGLQFTLPMAHDSSRIFVHDSLTGGNTYITHDPTVANGTVQLGLDFSKDRKQDEAVYDGCMVQLKHGTGVALIPRERDGARAQIASLALHFPDSVAAPAVQLMRSKKHLSDNKLRKLIQWWRKHHKKEE